MASCKVAEAGSSLSSMFALSGSEQNPDLTGKDIKLTLSRVRPGATAPVEAHLQHGADFVVARTLPELVAGMNKLTPEPLLELADLERQMHGYRSLEGSFLGGCLFSGRQAGRAVAEETSA